MTMTVLLTNNLGNKISLAEGTTRAVDVVIDIGKTTEPLRVKLPYGVTILDAPDGMVFRAVPAVVFLDLSLGVNAQRNGLSDIAPEVRVGDWDPANPMRQIQLNLPSDVRLLNDMPFVRLERVGDPPGAPTDAPASETTQTPQPVDAAATPSPTEPGTTPVVATATPAATASATASGTPTSTPAATATP
jgi:hypothetical protein